MPLWRDIRNMQIPKKLKILAHNYSIKEVDGLPDEGSFNWLENVILINKKLPQSRKEAVLFHEIIHAINSELNEEMVEFLAQNLYQVLKKNNMLR